MKKIIVATLLFSFAGSVWAANQQAQWIGTFRGVVESTPTAQVGLTTPKRTGQLLYCTDCVQTRLCISSGTTIGAWVVTSSSGPGSVGGYPHCQ